jgi:hypothetical protein
MQWNDGRSPKRTVKRYTVFPNGLENCYTAANTHQAFSLAHNANSSMWDYFKANPEKGNRFAQVMSNSSGKKDLDTDLLLANVAWPDDGVVVDLGGSHGSIAIRIARRFPKVRCIVQDLPNVVQKGKMQLPGDLSEQIDFMAQ